MKVLFTILAQMDVALLSSSWQGQHQVPVVSVRHFSLPNYDNAPRKYVSFQWVKHVFNKCDDATSILRKYRAIYVVHLFLKTIVAYALFTRFLHQCSPRRKSFKPSFDRTLVSYSIAFSSYNAVKWLDLSIHFTGGLPCNKLDCTWLFYLSINQTTTECIWENRTEVPCR